LTRPDHPRVSKMVIVVIGEMESSSRGVGRLLAESLGWEFADIESLLGGAATRSPLSNAKCPAEIEVLSHAIYSLSCEWRDVIISCPALTDKDQRQLRHDQPSVKFVRLKKADGGGTVKDHEGLLSVDSSLGVEQILGAVLSALILKQDSSHAEEGLW
jgi:hypothetical protein